MKGAKGFELLGGFKLSGGFGGAKKKLRPYRDERRPLRCCIRNFSRQSTPADPLLRACEGWHSRSSSSRERTHSNRSSCCYAQQGRLQPRSDLGSSPSAEPLFGRKHLRHFCHNRLGSCRSRIWPARQTASSKCQGSRCYTGRLS